MRETALNFTDRDLTLMSLAWQSFKAPPDIDFEKFAGLAGYTNVGSAKNFVLALKKKINAVKSIADAPKPTATPSKKRAKSAIGRTSDDEDVSPRTPKKKKVSEKERELSTTATKRPRKNKHKSSVYVHPDADSEDGDDEEKIHLPIPANPLSDIFEIGRSVKEPAVKPEPED